MGTYNPAKIINEDARIGSIEVGKQADLCVLDDNFDIEKVMLKGKIIKNVKLTKEHVKNLFKNTTSIILTIIDFF